MEFPELLCVLLSQDYSAEIPAVEARLRILAEANGGNDALSVYLNYFSKTKTTPDVAQLKSHASCYPKSRGSEWIAVDLENAEMYKDCPPNNLPLALERAWEDANQGYVLAGYMEARQIAGANIANPYGYTSRRYEKRMNELYGDEASWDRSAFSQIWLMEYLNANPFAHREADQTTPETEHEFELAKGVGVEDKEVVQVSLKAVKATDIQPAALKWLWPDRIPYGKICWFAGKPDCGKSLALLDLIARITTGNDWPDKIKNTWGPHEVLIAISEDGLGDTVIPRLNAAGADLNHIRFIQRVIVKSGADTTRRQLQLSNDTNLLKKALADNPNVVLVALDPITSFFGDVNINVDKDIRPIMDALSAVCNASGVSFVSVVHHNKRSDVDALQKILGASSVVGAARTAWGFSRDPDNKEEFFMSLVKNNLSKRRTGMKYKIGEKEVDGILAPYTVWGEETESTANDLLDAERDTTGRKDGKQITLARIFLPAALSKGPRLARELYAEAEKEGISADQLKRARYELPIHVVRQGTGWVWSMREEDPIISGDVI